MQFKLVFFLFHLVVLSHCKENKYITTAHNLCPRNLLVSHGQGEGLNFRAIMPYWCCAIPKTYGFMTKRHWMVDVISLKPRCLPEYSLVPISQGVFNLKLCGPDKNLL